MKFDVLVYGLLESTSPLRTMYHITSMANAVEIIDSNTFKLSKQDTSGKKLFRKYNYSMSTARNLTSAYFNLISKLPVILELDGSKLSDKGYVIKPIHDFTELDRTIEDREKIGRFELEDRVLSKTPIIPNAKSFIKAINFYHSPDYGDTFSQISSTYTYHSITEAYNVFKNSGIPAFVYTNSISFRLLDKRKAKHIA